MAVAQGSMGEAKFFTIRQCPDCMCDLPHRGAVPGIQADRNELIPNIGTIIQKSFPRGRAAEAPIGANLPSTLPRLGPQASICLQPELPRKGSRSPDPTDFRCETAQWQVF